MFSIFKKKIIVPHVRLTGVIGNLGRFRQGMDLASQQDILKKAFAFKKSKNVERRLPLLLSSTTGNFLNIWTPKRVCWTSIFAPNKQNFKLPKTCEDESEFDNHSDAVCF